MGPILNQSNDLKGSKFILFVLLLQKIGCVHLCANCLYTQSRFDCVSKKSMVFHSIINIWSLTELQRVWNNNRLICQSGCDFSHAILNNKRHGLHQISKSIHTSVQFWSNKIAELLVNGLTQIADKGSKILFISYDVDLKTPQINWITTFSPTVNVKPPINLLKSCFVLQMQLFALV